jgi:isopentenyl-diphosphate Delta-isomerase
MPKNNLDQVILVNENDEQIGVMDKIDAHLGEGKLHRAASVFLHNAKGEWLIQKRSSLKIVGAGQWANTCCGNVRPGESYQECAQRRLQEELGIEGVKLNFVDKFTYFAQCNEKFSEREIDSVYIGEFDDKKSSVVPNSEEVTEYKWISAINLLSELKEDQKNSIKKYVPWLQIIVDKKLIPAFS